MTSRTVVDSVQEVKGVVAQAPAADAALDALRLRFPGAIFGRYLGLVPQVAEGVRIAPGAAVVGDVRIRAQASVWYGCVLRGDVNFIEIGARSNVQDGCVLHVGDLDPTVVEPDVVIGHRAVVHGCTVGEGTLIGVGAVVLDGASIGAGSLVAASALVPAAAQIPPRSLVVGVPGKVLRTLEAHVGESHRKLAAKYCRLAHNYRVG